MAAFKQRTMVMKLDDVYRGILKATSIQCDETSKLYIALADGDKRYLSYPGSGKIAYLPNEQSASFAPLNNGLLFNPLNENILSIDTFWSIIANNIVDQINATLSAWVYQMAVVAESSNSDMLDMDDSIIEVFKEWGEVPKDFAARMLTFAGACREDNKNHRYIDYKIISKKASDKDSVFNRRCTAWSPYKETIEKLYTGEWSTKSDDKKRVAGAVLRKGDGAPFLKLISIILPNLSQYRVDSLSQLAPTMHSFVMCMNMVYKDMQNFYDKIKSMGKLDTLMCFDPLAVEWISSVDKKTSEVIKYPNGGADNSVAISTSFNSADVNSPLSDAKRKMKDKLLKSIDKASTTQNAYTPQTNTNNEIQKPMTPTTGYIKNMSLEDIQQRRIEPSPVYQPQPIQAYQSLQTNLNGHIPNASSNRPGVVDAHELLRTIEGDSYQHRATRVVKPLFGGDISGNKHLPKANLYIPSMNRITPRGSF